MAGYNITFTCGHREFVRLTGSDSHIKADYMAKNNICSECYKEQKQEEKAEKHKGDIITYLAYSNIEELPELSGSEKQISWANKIREDMMTEFINSSWFRNYSDKAPEEYIVKIKEAMKSFVSNDSAKFWIDNRDRQSKTILASYIQE